MGGRHAAHKKLQAKMKLANQTQGRFKGNPIFYSDLNLIKASSNGKIK